MAKESVAVDDQVLKDVTDGKFLNLTDPKAREALKQKASETQEDENDFDTSRQDEQPTDESVEDDADTQDDPQEPDDEDNEDGFDLAKAIASVTLPAERSDKHGDETEETEEAEIQKQVESLGLKEKQAEAFKELRLSSRKAQRELQHVQEELKSVRGSSDTQEDLSGIREENEQLRRTIAEIDISRDPEFQERYDKRIIGLKEDAKALAKQFELPDNYVDEIMGMGVKDRAEKLSNDVPTAAPVLIGYLSEAERLLRERANAIKSGAETHQKHVTDRAKEAESLREEVYKATIEKLSHDHPLLKKVEGNDKWNRQVDKVVQAISGAFRLGHDQIDEQGKLLALGVMAPVYKALYDQTRELVVKMSSDDAVRQKMKARIKSGPSSQQSSRSSTRDSKGNLKSMTPEQAASRALQGLEF